MKQGEITVGDRINVCVPTGNFGNILAAYIAKLMGLPVEKLICASNSNNILTDFLSTGKYDRNRSFYLTMSPSMDILISSNLERLLYLISGTEETRNYMQLLSETGCYEIKPEHKSAINESFVGYFADESQTAEAIAKYYNCDDYLMDTHTAVAFSALDQYRIETADNTKTVVASTASPYKFAQSVYRSIFGTKHTYSDLEVLDELALVTGTKIPSPLYELEKKKVRFCDVTTPEDMYNEILRFIKK